MDGWFAGMKGRGSISRSDLRGSERRWYEWHEEEEEEPDEERTSLLICDEHRDGTDDYDGKFSNA